MRTLEVQPKNKLPKLQERSKVKIERKTSDPVDLAIAWKL